MLATEGTWRTYQQLSDELGWGINTVKTRLHRARQKICTWRQVDLERQGEVAQQEGK